MTPRATASLAPASRDDSGSSSAGDLPERHVLLRSLIVVSAVLGTAIVLIVAAVAFVVLRRRRRRLSRDQRSYTDTRDPYLAIRRPEHYDHRRRRLRWLTSLSPTLWGAKTRADGGGSSDAEAQRSEMIRKSLQSRTSVNVIGPRDTAAAAAAAMTPPLPPPPPSTPPTPTPAARTRSRTWNGGRQGSGRDRAADDEDGPECNGGGGNDEELRDAQARVDYTWELLNRKAGYSSSSPSAGDKEDGGGDDDDAPASRPPTVRLKTPPLLSHPAFRAWEGGVGTGGAGGGSPGPRGLKHSSLPTELTAIKPSHL